VWHFGDSSDEKAVRTLNVLWDEERKNTPDLKLIGRL